jgi:radical SAM-linked protein
MRIRITFAKTEAMRFTGHLDLHKTWERTIRRAGLPLAYSQGYNPRPRINLASALPLGFTSQAEVVDIWLEKDIGLAEISSALDTASPPGFSILEIDEVDPSEPTLQSQLIAAQYTITLLEDTPDLNSRLEDILNAKDLPRKRKNKTYDLRPLIESIHLIADDEQGSLNIVVHLTAREGATGRPDEVLLAMGLQPESSRIHRTRLIFRSDKH